MKTFIDIGTGQPWQFYDNDDVRLINGVYQVFDVNGKRVTSVPETLVPGELPPPVDPPPYIAQSVTPAQGLMALYLLKSITEDDILAAIGTIEDAALRYQAQISYQKATAWERSSVTMQTLAGLLALTDPDLDELFTKAATYTNL